MSETGVKVPSRRLPLWWLWVLLSLGTVVLSAWIRVTDAGWLLILGGIIFCGLMAVHPIVHAVAALRGGAHRRAVPILLLLSNLFFLLGFGLQTDAGDAPGSTVAFTAFYYTVLRGSNTVPVATDDWSNALLNASLVFLLAVIVSWVLLLVFALRKPKTKAMEAATA